MNHFPKITVTDHYIYIARFIWLLTNDERFKKQLGEISTADLTTKIKKQGAVLAGELSDKFYSVSEMVAQHTNCHWPSHISSIIVYPTFFRGFSHPLFLQVLTLEDGLIKLRDKMLMMGLLVHEICHNNLLKPKNLSHQINEAVVESLTLAILDNIDNAYAKQYENFLQKVHPDWKQNLPEEILSGNVKIIDYYNNYTNKNSPRL